MRKVNKKNFDKAIKNSITDYISMTTNMTQMLSANQLETFKVRLATLRRVQKDTKKKLYNISYEDVSILADYVNESMRNVGNYPDIMAEHQEIGAVIGNIHNITYTENVTIVDRKA